MLNPAATFDVFYLVADLTDRLGNATPGEVNLLGYLSCLLSILDKWPASEWGYSFAGLENGAPFSRELQEATLYLIHSGFVAAGDVGLQLSTTGNDQFGILKEMASFIPRQKYLKTACSTLKVFPIGQIRKAMSMEPGLRPLRLSGGAKPLLTDAALDQLYDDFDALIAAAGQYNQQLLIPASVWLSFLTEKALRRDEAIIFSSDAHAD